jgi:predicted O-methyltransferase YrrM
MTTSQVKLESLKDQIPLILDDVAHTLQHIIKKFGYKQVLEIGTAYGYSAHVMADAGAQVMTVERNLDRYHKAITLLNASIHQDHINILNIDAKMLTFEHHTFDLIFLDGAKSQYQNMFNSLSPYLNEHGMIICDNMFFHHLKKEDVKRHTRQLLTKIEKFHRFLFEHTEFETHILNIGDGLSISYKKNVINQDQIDELIASISVN